MPQSRSRWLLIEFITSPAQHFPEVDSQVLEINWIWSELIPTANPSTFNSGTFGSSSATPWMRAPWLVPTLSRFICRRLTALDLPDSRRLSLQHYSASSQVP